MCWWKIFKKVSTRLPGYGKSSYEKKMAEYSFFELDSKDIFPDFKHPTRMSYPGTNLKIAFNEFQSYTSTHFFSDDTLFVDKRGGIDLVEVI